MYWTGQTSGPLNFLNWMSVSPHSLILRFFPPLLSSFSFCSDHVPPIKRQLLSTLATTQYYCYCENVSNVCSLWTRARKQETAQSIRPPFIAHRANGAHYDARSYPQVCSLLSSMFDLNPQFKSINRPQYHSHILLMPTTKPIRCRVLLSLSLSRFPSHLRER